MNIEELKARQKEAEAWGWIADNLAKSLDDKLAKVKDQVQEQTGLSLWLSHRGSVRVNWGDSSFSVESRNLLQLEVTNVSVMVSIDSYACSTIRLPGGGWKVIIKGNELVESKPAIPLAIYRCRSAYPAATQEPLSPVESRIWWRGPEDDEKLTAFVVDALNGRERPPEFDLGREAPL